MLKMIFNLGVVYLHHLEYVGWPGNLELILRLLMVQEQKGLQKNSLIIYEKIVTTRIMETGIILMNLKLI